MTKKGFTVIEGVIVVALVLVVIGIVSMSKKKTELPTSTTTVTDTGDWKTYTSVKYGYSIKYPTTWKLDASKPEIVSLNSPDNEALLAMNNTNNLSVEGYSPDMTISYADSIATYVKYQGFEATTLDELVAKDQTLTDINDTMLGKELAKEATVEGGYGAHYIVQSNHNNHYYQISFGTNTIKDTLTTEMKTILSSFAFTK